MGNSFLYLGSLFKVVYLTISEVNSLLPTPYFLLYYKTEVENLNQLPISTFIIPIFACSVLSPMQIWT